MSPFAPTSPRAMLCDYWSGLTMSNFKFLWCSGKLSARSMKKEVEFYHLEASQNEARVQGMKDEGKDIYDIKKAEEVRSLPFLLGSYPLGRPH